MAAILTRAEKKRIIGCVKTAGNDNKFQLPGKTPVFVTFNRNKFLFQWLLQAAGIQTFFPKLLYIIIGSL